MDLSKKIILSFGIVFSLLMLGLSFLPNIDVKDLLYLQVFTTIGVCLQSMMKNNFLSEKIKTTKIKSLIIGIIVLFGGVYQYLTNEIFRGIVAKNTTVFLIFGLLLIVMFYIAFKKTKD